MQRVEDLRRPQLREDEGDQEEEEESEAEDLEEPPQGPFRRHRRRRRRQFTSPATNSLRQQVDTSWNEDLKSRHNRVEKNFGKHFRFSFESETEPKQFPKLFRSRMKSETDKKNEFVVHCGDNTSSFFWPGFEPVSAVVFQLSVGFITITQGAFYSRCFDDL